MWRWNEEYNLIQLNMTMSYHHLISAINGTNWKCDYDATIHLGWLARFMNYYYSISIYTTFKAKILERESAKKRKTEFFIMQIGNNVFSVQSFDRQKHWQIYKTGSKIKWCHRIHRIKEWNIWQDILCFSVSDGISNIQFPDTTFLALRELRRFFSRKLKLVKR